MRYEVTKDPSADLDYGFDWTAWLGAGDTFTESTWAVPVASGLTIHSPSISTDGKITTVWLKSGNASGAVYAATNNIKTAAREGKTSGCSG